MSKHPMPWKIDHKAGYERLLDANGLEVLSDAECGNFDSIRELPEIVVALTEVAVAAGKFFRAKHGSSADLVKAGEQVEAKLTALEALL